MSDFPGFMQHPGLDPQGLPQPDSVPESHPKVQELRMLTIPNQSSVAKAFLEFDEAWRMKPSAYYDRVVDVMEELMKFTLLTRDVGHWPIAQ
jgi:NAD(P)H-dependent FMN reductase